MSRSVTSLLPRVVALVIAVSLALAAAGCTSEQGYNAAQGWQTNQCNRTPDNAERERCLARAGTSYDNYRRETDAVRKP